MIVFIYKFNVLTRIEIPFFTREDTGANVRREVYDYCEGFRVVLCADEVPKDSKTDECDDYGRDDRGERSTL